MNTIPRRAKMQEWCPAEKAISDAIQEVEKMPADIRLTNAVMKLSEVKELVADFIDGIETPISPEPKQPTDEEIENEAKKESLLMRMD